MYRIEGLAPQAFESLFSMMEGELAEHQADERDAHGDDREGER